MQMRRARTMAVDGVASIKFATGALARSKNSQKRPTAARAAAMMTSLTSSLVLALVAGAAAAELEIVTVGSDITCYESGDASLPAVIVIQEWWGVTEGIKAKALKIAGEGYRVIVPDVYKGKVGVNKEEASHLMSTLDFQNAVAEMSAVAAYLKATGSPAVGVTGFCMGGALTMGALAASDDIDCGAPFYGVNFGLFDAATLAKPVQGHFGKLDTMAGFSDPATGEKLEGELVAAGNANAKVYLYDKVGHAFMNDSPAPFETFAERERELGFPEHDPDQAALAWSRLFAFLGTWLKETASPEL